jgi:ubiquinone/menaquinone biosynthesis C-methylase UbiE
MSIQDDIARSNKKHWEKMVREGCGFTVPWLDLDRDVIRRYAGGELEPVPETLMQIHPATLLADVEGKDVLCLASGGGQQSAVFGVLGARVTVVDFAEGQLDGDRKAAAHYGYDVTTIQADMRDLSSIADESFDLVYQADSMAYVPDARQVYSEVARVTRTGAIYAVAFTNPAAEFAEWDGEAYRIAVPYAEKTLPKPDWAAEFRHYMGEIFNGLIDLGFSIQQVEENPAYLRGAQARPGSWATFLPGFVVVARKDCTA